jgi:hypothetical protein
MGEAATKLGAVDPTVFWEKDVKIFLRRGWVDGDHKVSVSNIKSALGSVGLRTADNQSEVLPR